MGPYLGVIACLEEDFIIVLLIFHGSFGAFVDSRVEDLVFEDKSYDGHVDLEDSSIISL